MIIRLLCLCCIISFISVKAQPVAFNWAKSMSGGASSDDGRSIAVDTFGNVYTTGAFGGTADFDPGSGTFNLTASGNDNVFISKLNASGNFVWAKKISSTIYSQAKSIQVDASGNLYITGIFMGTADFDPGSGSFNLSSSSGLYDVFILKLNASGNFVWAKNIGGNSQNYAYSVAVNTKGDVYTTGNFSGRSDFNPGAGVFNLTAVGYDIFILKLDSSGNFTWAKNMGRKSNNYSFNVGSSIALDKSGNVYATGTFQSIVDFDPGSGTANLVSADSSEDVFIAKFDASGNFIWAKNLSGNGSDNGLSIALDVSGNVYTTGNFMDTVDFDPGSGMVKLISAGNYDVFISKLDSAGNFVWARSFGGKSADLANAIALDLSGNIYTTGLFKGQVDFNPGTGTYYMTASGSNGFFISKLDGAGNFRWAQSMGGTSSQYGNAIRVDAAGKVYTTGNFRGTTDFDPGSGTFYLSTTDSSNIFVHKMSQGTCIQGYSTISVADCNSYTSPSGKYTWRSSATYKDTLYNYLGCDSVITINLSINKTSKTLNQTTCDSFKLNGKTYTVSGIYQQTLINAAGCDSVLTLNLTVKKPTQGTLYQTACDSFRLNGRLYTTGGIYQQILTNTAGCDSNLTLNLTIKKATTGILNQAVCDSFKLNGKTYTASGIYSQTLINAAGCDSTLTLNLTVRKPTAVSVNQAACDSFKLNGKTYTTSGIYTQTLTNIAGCDSILTLNLSIRKSTAGNFSQTACDSFKLNGRTYTSSGIYTQTLVNTSGCDSTLTLNLTIHSILATVVLKRDTLTASDSGAQYIWLDCDDANKPITGATSQAYIAKKNGRYAVVVMKGSCTDTSSCVMVSTLSGLQQPNTPNNLSIYPNPFSAVLTVVFSDLTDMEGIEVYNSVGVLVYQSGRLSEINTIDLNGHANGLYMVKVMSNKQPVTRIIIKQ
jgi:hypothetical protein